MRQLREIARNIRQEAAILWVACRDPRVPWYAKALVGLAVALTLSPVDLIPDVIPVLGHVDDVVVVPALIVLARALIPRDVIASARALYETEGLAPQGRPIVAFAVTGFLWALLLLATGYLMWHLLGGGR